MLCVRRRWWPFKIIIPRNDAHTHICECVEMLDFLCACVCKRWAKQKPCSAAISTISPLFLWGHIVFFVLFCFCNALNIQMHSAWEIVLIRSHVLIVINSHHGEHAFWIYLYCPQVRTFVYFSLDSLENRLSLAARSNAGATTWAKE
jgi:hypothetical protein